MHFRVFRSGCNQCRKFCLQGREFPLEDAMGPVAELEFCKIQDCLLCHKILPKQQGSEVSQLDLAVCEHTDGNKQTIRSTSSSLHGGTKCLPSASMRGTLEMWVINDSSTNSFHYREKPLQAIILAPVSISNRLVGSLKTSQDSIIRLMISPCT